MMLMEVCDRLPPMAMGRLGPDVGKAMPRVKRKELRQ